MKLLFTEMLQKLKTSFAQIENEPTNPSDWPEEWKRIEYKEYQRFRKVPLNPGGFSGGLIDSLEKRNSLGKDAIAKLNLRILSSILHYSCGKREGSNKRFYPSAGARYPLEVYVIINKNLEDLQEGVYHYNVGINALEFMWKQRGETKQFLGFYKEKNDSDAFIIATSVIERSSRKYGELAFKYSYIETGALLQNVLLLSTALGISNSICNHDDFVLEESLDIDGVNEFVAGVVALGFRQIG